MKYKAFIASALLLTACAGEEDETKTLDSIQSARSGVRVGMEFIEKTMEEESFPAVISGTRAGLLLSDAQKISATIPDPIDTGIPESGVKADTELLEIFIELLSADVQGLLNQSANREDALDNYIKSIESHTQKGHIRLLSLQNREDDLHDDTKRLERGTRDVRNQLDDAISEGRSSIVSALTNELVGRQTKLAEAQAELAVTSRLVEAFGEILEPLGERIDAIKRNRDPLIKGVRVIDMPGVDDLKIIETEDGVPRIRRRSGGLF
jgi:hypothetical protein